MSFISYLRRVLSITFIIIFMSSNMLCLEAASIQPYDDTLRAMSLQLRGQEDSEPWFLKENHGTVKIIVESGAGLHCGFTDEDYREMGAEIVDSAQDIYSQAHVILKVKEPEDLSAIGRNDEAMLMQNMPKAKADDYVVVIGIIRENRPDEGRVAVPPAGVKQILDFVNTNGCYVGDRGRLEKLIFTYWHLAAMRRTTELVMTARATAIGMESITTEMPSEQPLFRNKMYIDSQGEPGRIDIPAIVKDLKERLGHTCPTLDPMSVVAGKQIVMHGALCLNQEKARVDNSGKFIIDEDWVNEQLAKYPDGPQGKPLQGKVVLITGAGTLGLSALQKAVNLGAKIIITDLQENINLINQILCQEYGDTNVGIATSKEHIDIMLNSKDIIIMAAESRELIKPALGRSCMAIGAAYLLNERAPQTITAKDIKETIDQNPDLILYLGDPAKDQGGNFPVIDINGDELMEIDYTIHSAPIHVGYKGRVLYNLVANLPGRPIVPGKEPDLENPAPVARAASLALWESRWPYLQLLLEHGLIGAV